MVPFVVREHFRSVILFRWFEITKWRGDVVVFMGARTTPHILLMSLQSKFLSERGWVC